jgi:hypothetical protein
MEVFRVEIHQNQPIIMENMGTVTYVLVKIKTVTKPTLIKFIFSWQLFINNPYTKFYKTQARVWSDMVSTQGIPFFNPYKIPKSITFSYNNAILGKSWNLQIIVKILHLPNRHTGFQHCTGNMIKFL